MDLCQENELGMTEGGAVPVVAIIVGVAVVLCIATGIALIATDK